MGGPQNRVGGHPDAGRPGNSGPGTGGFFPGGFNNDDPTAPPPPYSSKAAPTPNEQPGWRPGFWTGLGLGGLGAHLLNNRQNQNSRAYDWERERAHRPPPTTGGLFGQRSTARDYSQEDRGEGSSNLGAMRRSTGLGGSSVR